MLISRLSAGMADGVCPGVKVVAGGVVELVKIAFCGSVVTVELGVGFMYS